MSSLCQRPFTMQVINPPCLFIQDTSGFNTGSNAGVAYSPQRNEVAVSSSHIFAGVWLINASTRVGGPVNLSNLIAIEDIAWCPANSKYYLCGTTGSLFQSYNPATNIFDPTVVTSGNFPKQSVYAPSKGKMYILSLSGTQSFIDEVDPATNNVTNRFTSASNLFFGFTINYASSINSLVGGMNDSTGNIFSWVFNLNTFTMSTTQVLAAGNGNLNGTCWDSTRGRIWIDMFPFGAANTFYLLSCPPGGMPDFIFSGLTNMGSSTYITYDLASDSIYHVAFNITAIPLRMKLADHTIHQLSDPGFGYADEQAVIANGIFYFVAQQAGKSGVRSCGIGVFP